jgi:hypothetical protein
VATSHFSQSGVVITSLFSYRIIYKVATRYTPYQLVYGLHPLVPTKYIVPVASGDQRDITLLKVLLVEFQNWKSFRRLGDALPSSLIDSNVNLR